MSCSPDSTRLIVWRVSPASLANSSCRNLARARPARDRVNAAGTVCCGQCNSRANACAFRQEYDALSLQSRLCAVQDADGSSGIEAFNGSDHVPGHSRQLCQLVLAQPCHRPCSTNQTHRRIKGTHLFGSRRCGSRCLHRIQSGREVLSLVIASGRLLPRSFIARPLALHLL
jgi:hypothetical protein